jgi:hypothetical protein
MECLPGLLSGRSPTSERRKVTSAGSIGGLEVAEVEGDEACAGGQQREVKVLEG